MDPRLRPLCDLTVAESWEYAGRPEYDCVLQDLSALRAAPLGLLSSAPP